MKFETSTDRPNDVVLVLVSNCLHRMRFTYAQPVQSSSSSRAGLPIVVAVLATTSVILPAFLTGAMAVQIRADLLLSESDIGLALGVFFGGSAAGSFLLGRLAQTVGPRPAVRMGLGVTALADVLVVVGVNDARSLQMTLALAGLANALCQPAVNLLLVRLIEPGRLGTAMALKQSGMPGASLLGGLAVPALALTVGWRAAYLLAAAVALTAITLSFVHNPTGEQVNGERSHGKQPNSRRQNSRRQNSKAALGGRTSGLRPDRSHPDDRPVDRRETTGHPTRDRPDQSWAMLGLLAGVGVLGGGAANILVAYLVSGAVAAGIAPGPAGLLLTLGSALGIASRLTNGLMADRGRLDPPTTVIALFAGGCLGTLALSLELPVAYLIGTPVAFAAGWAWPGLFNLIVVQANRSAPAAATGVTQTGVYVGALTSPVTAGVLIERSGYRAAWLLAAALLAGATMLAFVARTGLSRRSNATGADGDGRTPAAKHTPVDHPARPTVVMTDADMVRSDSKTAREKR